MQIFLDVDKVDHVDNLVRLQTARCICAFCWCSPGLAAATQGVSGLVQDQAPQQAEMELMVLLGSCQRNHLLAVRAVRLRWHNVS